MKKEVLLLLLNYYKLILTLDLEKQCQNETENDLGNKTIQANLPSSDQPPNQPANKQKHHKNRMSKKSKPNVPDLTADHSADVAAAPSEVTVYATSETTTSAASEATIGPDRPVMRARIVSRHLTESG